MNDDENKIDFNEFVKIYSNDNVLISLLGSVFHNKKSRAMWLLLSNTKKEFYLKEMAVIIEKTENPRLPIYEHHINTMVKSGIVLMQTKMHNKHLTKFYRAAPIVMITSPQLYEKASTSKTLRNTFKKVFKFALIGIVTFSTFMITDFNHNSNIYYQSEFPFLLAPLSVLIISLIVERILSFKK